MAFVRFDERFMIGPCGFRNAGATCYFNAVVQSLLSCTSLNQTILEAGRQGDAQANPVIQAYIKILAVDNSQMHDDKKAALLKNLCPALWEQIHQYASGRNEKIRLDRGQQCAGEGFHLFLQSVEDIEPIQRLFMHRYKTEITCAPCAEVVTTKKDDYGMFEVQPNLSVEQHEDFKEVDDQYGESIPMREFLQKQNGFVEGYKCPQCGDKANKFTSVKLTMVPEILVVMSKKYSPDGRQKRGMATPFPAKISFRAKHGLLEYEAVSQIEHAGSLGGGHYWAISRRRGGWFRLDDTRMAAAKFEPTNNTYMVFYHLM